MTIIISLLLQMGKSISFLLLHDKLSQTSWLKTTHIRNLRVWFLIGELRSHMLCSAAKKKLRHGLVGGPSAQGLTRLQSRYQLDCVPIWRFDWRRLCFQIPSNFWQNSFPPGYTDRLSFLSLVGWRQFLSTRGFPVYQSVSSREKAPVGCVCGYKHIYSKELAYMQKGAGKYEIHRADQQGRNSQAGGKAAVLGQNFFIPQRNFSFVLLFLVFLFGTSSLTRDGTSVPCSVSPGF